MVSIGKIFGQASFTPTTIQNAVNIAQNSKTSIVQEKSATPAEAAKEVKAWDESLRPHHIMAERSARSQTTVHNNYQAIFSKFGDLHIQTGATMVDQHNAWFLGMAFPFTLPSVVGSYDVPNKLRWRRPENDDVPLPRDCLTSWMHSLSKPHQYKLPVEHAAVSTACPVKLFDITRGLPQRIEGQYRRHWGFTPALWNLYFRERLSLGIGLSVKRGLAHAPVDDGIETDAAIAAAGLLKNWKMVTIWIEGKDAESMGILAN